MRADWRGYERCGNVAEVNTAKVCLTLEDLGHVYSDHGDGT